MAQSSYPIPPQLSGAFARPDFCILSCRTELYFSAPVGKKAEV
jgi:hypothetical protein